MMTGYCNYTSVQSPWLQGLMVLYFQFRQNVHPLCFCFSGQEQCFNKVQSRSGKVETNVQLNAFRYILFLKSMMHGMRCATI